jgi:hypothetical protein
MHRVRGEEAVRHEAADGDPVTAPVRCWLDVARTDLPNPPVTTVRLP